MTVLASGVNLRDQSSGGPYDTLLTLNISHRPRLMTPPDTTDQGNAFVAASLDLRRFQAKLANSVHEPINPQHCTNNSSGIWSEPWRSELLSSMRHPQMLNTSHSLGWEGDEQLHQSSEALPVHDRGAGLVVLALGDPHLLEGAQRRQDGAADPDGV
eukprot:CAMPEP_0204112228 /NCGR_PEP_ID=MMETSP0361-20130328/2925_1 /ASSEMBLY_ACC=CAM_ASM_000343 /TAXON_ID=268821 /ORGANISM="Scrippsiella Hangoei, Strain SHTV-5" /LENGTH=156 /DNA_ID=CAMNT_0051062389 /DNA_START=64 /DNA_END=531 /DNA_ORIENTATION=+